MEKVSAEHAEVVQAIKKRIQEKLGNFTHQPQDPVEILRTILKMQGVTLDNFGHIREGDGTLLATIDLSTVKVSDEGRLECTVKPHVPISHIDLDITTSSGS